MMINLKINRKGDERVLSMYWFILFIIVAVAIVSAVLIFYSYLLFLRIYLKIKPLLKILSDYILT